MSQRYYQQLGAKGFTIVEGLIGITVTVVLLMILMNFMANYFRQNTIGVTRANLLADSQQTLDTIGEYIRLSASADQNNRWPDPHAPTAADELSWQSDGTTLILATAVEDQAGHIVFADASQYISEKNNNIFFVQNGKLYQRVLAAPVTDNNVRTSCPAEAASEDCPSDRVLAEHVESLSIRYFSGIDQEVSPTQARSIELRLTLAKQQFNQTITATYTTRMVFRND